MTACKKKKPLAAAFTRIGFQMVADADAFRRQAQLPADDFDGHRSRGEAPALMRGARCQAPLFAAPHYFYRQTAGFAISRFETWPR